VFSGSRSLHGTLVHLLELEQRKAFEARDFEQLQHLERLLWLAEGRRAA